MPATLDRPQLTDRLRQALRLRTQIDKLERRLNTLVRGVPKHLLARNRYGFTAAEMNTIARNLHARAKERTRRRSSPLFSWKDSVVKRHEIVDIPLCVV